MHNIWYSIVNMIHLYAEIAVSCPLRQTFDYIIPKNTQLKPGMRVKIPFGRRTVTGLVIKTKSTSSYGSELKAIIEPLDQEAIISAELLQLGIWASQYYQHPIGEVLVGMLPSKLRQGKTLKIYPSSISSEFRLSPSNIILHQEQQAAVHHIATQLEQFNAFLLYGITGSGKTEVYFRVIEEVLKNNQQILFLIPEISLSPQTVQRFLKRFNNNYQTNLSDTTEKCLEHGAQDHEPVLSKRNIDSGSCVSVIHSGLTDKQRLTAWMQAQNGEAKIIIGTRSAIFTPFKNLGIIIIDEEHDASFKQQSGFRYSARDVAIKRAHNLNIPIILGSATPSAESYHNALKKKYQLIELKIRAGGASIPSFKLIATTTKNSENGLTSETIDTIQQHLSRQEQVLIFINRRGYSPAWFCQSCHWQANCTRCDSHLVFHKKDKKLICHHCGHQEKITLTCPQCHSRSLLALGEGTQRIAETLEHLFTHTPVFRIDRDNIKNKNQLTEQLDHIHASEACILVGTQMLSKGHHFPNVTLVVILGVDYGLMSHDFHALENTAQLILQVAGRAGRANKPGTVLLQTFQPEHPQLQAITQHPYDTFLKGILTERQEFHLPPFSYLALFRVEAKQQDQALLAISAIQAACKANNSIFDQESFTIHDPVPSPMQRKAGFYQFQLLLQANNRAYLYTFLRYTLADLDKIQAVKKARWSIEIDPIDLL